MHWCLSIFAESSQPVGTVGAAFFRGQERYRAHGDQVKIRLLGTSTRKYPGECVVVCRDRSEPDHHGPRGSCFHAVVDLGEEHSGFAARAAAVRPEVVVLTHDDQDHIGGAAEFFTELEQGSCRPEFWLPADWLLLDAAYAAVTSQTANPNPNPNVDVDALVAALNGASLAPLFSEDPGEPDRSADAEVDADPRDPRLADMVRSEVAEAVVRHRDHIRRILDAAGIRAASPQKIADRVLRTSQIIRDIIRKARASGGVRWFSVDIESPGTSAGEPWQQSGRPGLLTLVNARPVRLARPLSLPGSDPDLLLLAFALTVQNRRALVPFVPPPAGQPAGGAIIWSDSDGAVADVAGGSGRTPWQHTGLMTAPHHGSTAREHVPIWDAMDRANPASGDPVRVLLSNNSRQTTARYRDVPGCLRGCTICSNYQGVSRRDVSAVFDGRSWAVRDRCREHCGSCHVEETRRRVSAVLSVGEPGGCCLCCSGRDDYWRREPCGCR